LTNKDLTPPGGIGMKVTIMGGAGNVGSSSAFRLAQDGFASEIVLVDPRSNVAQAHALDIEQAIVHRAPTQLRAGEIKDSTNSDIIIVALGLWGRPTIATRGDNLKQSLKLLLNVVPSLIAGSPKALWIIVSNPVDVLAYWIHRTFDIDRSRIIGTNGNDTARFRWAIAKALGVPAPGVAAFVLGEHGESQVRVFSHVRINERPVSLDDEQVKQVTIKLGNFVPDWYRLQPGRTAGWTTAESVGDIVASMASDDGKIWVCSTPLEGEYGLQQVSLGVPVRVSLTGVKEIVEFDLDRNEKAGLTVSAEKVRDHINQAEAFVDEALAEMERSVAAIKGARK
jgi:malate dehydrogenase